MISREFRFALLMSGSILGGFALFWLLYDVLRTGPYFALGSTLFFFALSTMLFRWWHIAVRHKFVDTCTNALREISFGLQNGFQGRSGFTELDELYLEARSISQQFSAKLQAALRKKDESDAVLASMMEGVIAVDNDCRILTINHSAQRLLGVSVSSELSPDLADAISDAPFLELTHKILDTHQPLETEVVIQGKKETILQVHGSPLLGSTSGSSGAVLVFHDVTHLRKLETIRQDFVANVSHELKTPITSIKGFVETLLDGALDDKADAQRFLGIVSRQADRLTAIIEDLLSLSRLEQEGGSHEVVRENVTMHEIIERSCLACILKADEKRITFERNLDRSLRLYVNPHLIEQALINLLSNAVKYSHERGKILVKAWAQENDIFISVHDFGIGIPEKDLPRLFERFYRVDRARSRNMGGTGLGLAIVKHIAQAHRGRVSVDSKLNEGSVFTVYLPGAAIASKSDSVSSSINQRKIVSLTPPAAREKPPTKLVEGI